jgi:aspartate oxidase
MTITYALMEKLEKIEKETGRAKILTKARATKLLTDQYGSVVGVEYEINGKTETAQGPVVISTGGFAADYGQDSLLAQYHPEWLHLPTTNGDHCTGDGIKIATSIGALTKDIDYVQIHPTGLVHPDDPDAQVKWLAAEALRGESLFLLSSPSLPHFFIF